MKNESLKNKLEWSRWAQIVQTSPSGKTLFVCLVCGDRSPGPTLECKIKDALDGRRSLINDTKLRVRTCSEVESLINETIEKSLPEHLCLDLAENELRSIHEKYCDSCHGYGCQVCLGKGRRW